MGGGGSAPTPPTVGKQLSSAVGALQQSGGAIASEENKIDPQMVGANTTNVQSELNSLSGFYYDKQLPQAQQNYDTTQATSNQFNADQLQKQLPGVTSSIYNSNPGVAGLTAAANKFTNAGQDSTLQTLEGQQQANTRGAAFTGVNNFVQGQVGTTSAMQSALNASSAKQTAANGTNVVSQATESNAVSQLALGSSLSKQQMDLAAQTSRAADSSRGVFHSTGSAASEILNTDQYGQQLLQQREGNANAVSSELNAEQGTANTFATNVGSLAQQETQNKTANAASLAQFDEQETQANRSAAVATQGSILQSQFQKQSLGVNQLQYLAGLGGSASTIGTSALLAPNQGNAQAAAANSLSGITPDVAPGFFNSLNVFGASQNASNQAFGAQEANFQQGQAQQQQMVAGGVAAAASIAGAGLIAL